MSSRRTNASDLQNVLSDYLRSLKNSKSLKEALSLGDLVGGKLNDDVLDTEDDVTSLLNMDDQDAINPTLPFTPSPSTAMLLLSRIALYSLLCDSWLHALIPKLGDNVVRFITFFTNTVTNLSTVDGGLYVIIESLNSSDSALDLIVMSLFKILANLQRIQMLLLIIKKTTHQILY